MSCFRCEHGYKRWSGRHCYYEEHRPWTDTCYRFIAKAVEVEDVSVTPVTPNNTKIIEIFTSTPVDSGSSSSNTFSSGGGGDFGGGGSDGSW